MSTADPPPGAEPERWSALVPELLVRDLAASLAFFRDLCGFEVRFARPEDGFVYLELGAAQIMLAEIAPDAWVVGPLEPPFGRGINFQVEVPDARALHDRILGAGVALYQPLDTAWYREGGDEHGQTEFLVQDPDGYLFRFVEYLGRRPAGDAPG
jgi:catechol 2,3-dioxygenase-like lactoylglutathione lyase family enzyme